MDHHRRLLTLVQGIGKPNDGKEEKGQVCVVYDTSKARAILIFVKCSGQQRYMPYLRAEKNIVTISSVRVRPSPVVLTRRREYN